MKVTQQDVLKALSSLEGELVSKASETDIDDPNGSQMNEHEHQDEGQLSDEAPKAGSKGDSLKSMKGKFMKKLGGEKAPAGHDEEEHDEEHGSDEMDMKSKAKKSYMDEDHVDESETHSEHKGSPSGKPYAKEGDDHAKYEKKGKGSDMYSKKNMKSGGEGESKKSFVDELPDEVTTKIDVSNFLKSLVDHTGEVIDDLREEVAKSELSHEGRYAVLEETLDDVQKSQAKIGIVLKAICQRIGIIENAPAAKPKAEAVAKGGGQERTFAKGLEAAQESDESAGQPLFKGLSQNPMIAKSQIATALCDLVKKGEASDLDVIGFESGGFIKPELVSKLQQTIN